MTATSVVGHPLVRDPVLFEIVKNSFATAANEMGVAVVRSSYSTLVKEAGDSSSAIFDQDGMLVSQSQSAPLSHLSSLRCSIVELLKDFPARKMRDGDVYLFNDPFRGGIHSNDVMVFRPIFIGGSAQFFTCALIHVADLGGMAAGGLPANATEHFHEGLMLPPVKYCNAGEINETLHAVIQANSRTPVKVIGDLNAMMAGTTVGGKRLMDMVDKWGFDCISRIAHEVMDYSEFLTRREIQKLPPGVYEGTDLIDDDGIDYTRRFMVKVSIHVDGQDLAIDLTGTDPQARGPINAAYSQSTSAIVYGVRCFMDPTIPSNEGVFRPLKLTLPYGTLVNPRPPAACNARSATRTAIVESIVAALSKAFPEKANASSSLHSVFTMAGLEPGTNRYWSFMDVSQGGLGARSIKDGVDVSAPIAVGGGTSSTPVEALEMEYPILFRNYRLWEDSGGPGKYRGGMAVERTVEILVDGEVTARMDRVRYPPQGVFGGSPGKAGVWVVNMDTPNEVRLPSKKTGFPLKKGDILTNLTSGGGGYGNPLERDPATVVEEVREGRVSMEAAREIYGVAINPATRALDARETERLRSAPPLPSSEEGVSTGAARGRSAPPQPK